MRNAQIRNFLLVLITLTFFSCQKEALIEVETTTTPTPTLEIANADAVQFAVEDGEITVVEQPADQDAVKMLEAIGDNNSEDAACEEKTMIAYEAALVEANSLCQPVFAEVNCEFKGGIISSILHVFPTVDCMTPIDDRDPTK